MELSYPTQLIGHAGAVYDRRFCLGSSALTERRYSSASSSLRRVSKSAIVLLIGSAVAISTPALRNVSSGNFDPPDLRKPRYFSTAPDSLLRTRWERATAAESPVAYL